MSILGERFGGRVDRIAAAQSLRILIVVAIVPPVITALDVHGSDIYTPGATMFVASGFAILMAATLAGGFVFQALRVPNGFVLGALAVAIPMTAAEINLSSLPTPVSNLGQLMIGAALGSRFHPEFLRGAHRFVGAVFATVLLSIVLSALFGVGIAWASGQHPADAGARQRAGRHRGNVHHREGPPARRAAGDRVPRHATLRAPARHPARVRARAAVVPIVRTRSKEPPR
jgi:uncharacterized membrane protein AbrB (regulator of aidB expression)